MNFMPSCLWVSLTHSISNLSKALANRKYKLDLKARIHQLKKEWKRIREHQKNKNWREFDQAQAEVDMLLSKVDALRDT